MFCPGCGTVWCSSNIVLWTIDWNAKLHRFGSSYIRPYATTATNQSTSILTQHTLSLSDSSVRDFIFWIRKSPTRKLCPRTSCHLCTGSLAMNTFGQSANCSRNVVLPLPTLPSMNTVYGCEPLCLSFTSMPVLLLANTPRKDGGCSLKQRLNDRRWVDDDNSGKRDGGGRRRNDDQRWRQYEHNDFITFLTAKTLCQSAAAARYNTHYNHTCAINGCACAAIAYRHGGTVWPRI